MALNYSHRPLFPSHISEDNLVSPMNMNGFFVEGSPENCWEVYGGSYHMSQGETESWILNSVWDSVERRGSPDSACKDIADLLPSDPFGMNNHITTTVTAITGLFGDFNGDYGQYIGGSENWSSQDSGGLFFPLNLVWNDTSEAQPKVDNGIILLPSSHPSENLNASSKMTQDVERDIEGALDFDDFKLAQACSLCGIVGSNNEVSSSSSFVQMQTREVDCAASSEVVPHEAFSVALRYVGVMELLSMEKVCKSLRSTIRNDPLLWYGIHIDQPLNEKVTDDVIFQLASRAQGDLQCLSLVECLRVTVDGLRRVLEVNPRITKLCVPGCTRLSIEGIIDLIRSHNSREHVLGIKLVRIGGLNVVKPEHLEDLKSILVSGKSDPRGPHRPHYCQWGSIYLPCDDERAIDVEECPRCDKIRMVYDCPAESCRAKEGPPCRACKMCIPRCDRCGTCIDERVFEETFCLDVLCSDCYKQPPVRYHVHDEDEEERAGLQGKVSVED